MSQLLHPVEAGISRHGDSLDTVFQQQFARRLALHKNMGKDIQEMSVPGTIPPEENLAWTKNTRYQVDRDLLFLYPVQEMEPEFILHKQYHLQWDQFYQFAGIQGSIQGQVHHMVCHLIVLSLLVPRRRKKAEQDFPVRALLLHGFNHRSSLFKFPQGSAVKPHHPVLRLKSLLKGLLPSPSSFNPQ